MNLPANARSCGTAMIAANLLLVTALSSAAMAQSGGDRAELERASRVAEALRQISLRGQSRSPGYYSDWQVKGDRIPVWSKQCTGRSITPEEFDANQATAGGIVTCIVRGMMRQEILTTRNDEALAVRRIAAWWVTGDSNQLNAPVVANYTQQVLSAYQPSRAGVIYEPPSPAPIAPPAVTPAPVIPAPVIPAPAPVLPPIAAPGQVVPTQELPPVAKTPTAPVAVTPEKPAEKPASKPADKPAAKPAEKPAEKPQAPAKEQPAGPKDKDKVATPIKSNGTTFYDRYMQVGYTASRVKDYRLAITAFRRALDERPGDSFAQKAIENMEAQLANVPKP